MLLANYHTHTTLCDGSDTPEAVAAEANRLGIKHLGFSGHMDPDIHMVWPDYVKAYEDAGAAELETMVNDAIAAARAIG